MFIFRMIEFAFQISTTIFIVLLLQVSVKGRTLEDYLMSYIRQTERLESIREVSSLISTSIDENTLIQPPSLNKTTKVNTDKSSRKSVHKRVMPPTNSMQNALDQVLPKISRKLSVFSSIVPNNSLAPEFRKIEKKSKSKNLKKSKK